MYIGTETAAESFATTGPTVVSNGARQSNGRKNLFGRSDLAATYHLARDLIVKHGIFRLVKVVESDDGIKRIVICNLWRIDRLPGGAIRMYEFLLAEERWVEVTTIDYWPEVPFFPIQKTQTLDWWRDVARRAVWKALIAAGYRDLPEYLAKIEWADDQSPQGHPGDRMPTPKEGSAVRPEMSPSKMAYILIRKYVGKPVGYAKNSKEKWHNGFLKPKTMMAGARALRAAIFDHVIDAQVLSAILAIDYKVVTLPHYLRYARLREPLLRVSQEQRNLLPLLPKIASAQWARKDLFSRKLWVRDGRRCTLVDYTRFSATEFNTFHSFDSPAAFRWLCKAQLTVVRYWSNEKDTSVLENLAKANITVRIPAIAWCHLIAHAVRWRIAELGVGEVAQRLYRVFATHCAVLWKNQGFNAVKSWLGGAEANLGDVGDWLIAEGIAQGHPVKNATWSSLLRRCQEWHERSAVEYVERSTSDNPTWCSLVPDTEFNGLNVMPLDSAKELALDGYRQHHCIGSYAHECVQGRYRAYTLIEPDGTRSTVGLYLGSDGNWSIDQHRGKYNSTPTDVAADAAKRLLALYRQAHAAAP
jgi:hypothetical protein